MILKALQYNPKVSIVVIVIVMLVFSIDSIPVSIMEARNFITAREMITDGNWFMTTMNGEARYEKPPLPTWMTALFGLVFGLNNSVALRFPAILFIALIGIFTYLLSKKILNDLTHSFINTFILITSFYVIAITLEAPWDIFTHGFMLMAIYHLFQLFQKEKHFGTHVFFAGLFFGCSILCKGPIGIYALLIPFILSYGFTYKFKAFNSKIFPIFVCIVIALIIGGSWYLFVRINDPQTFESIAIEEAHNWYSYDTRPFYYYWSFFTQSGIWTIPASIGLLYPYLKSRVSNLRAYQFTLIWTLSAVILLSLIPEKKSRYLMPVLIPLAMNTGFYIEYLIRKFKDLTNKIETLPVYFNFGLIALIAIAAPIAMYLLIGEKLSGQWFLFGVMSIVTIGLGIAILIQLKRKHIEHVFLLTCAFFITLLIIALPLFKPVMGIANKPIASLRQNNLNVYGLNYISPEIIWQFGDKIPPIKLEDGAYDFPTEDQFGMLSNDITPYDWSIIKRSYQVQKIEIFDLNTVPSEAKRYNDRLITDFYILTKL